MAIRDRLQKMGMFPNVGEITGMLDERFNTLLLELRAIHGVLDQILLELRTRGGVP